MFKIESSTILNHQYAGYQDTLEPFEAEEDCNYALIAVAGKPYMCPFCARCLSSEAKLQAHIKTRHEPKQLFCDHCGKCFARKTNLRLHMQHHRKYWELECRACNRKYKSIQSLRYHLRQHFELYMCEICGQEFESKKSLRTHIARMHGDMDKEVSVNEPLRYSCNACEEAFSLRKDLSDHQMSYHYCGKIFPCPSCDKKFKKKSLLELHSNVHRQQRYSCDQCLTTFTFKTGLKRHLQQNRCKGFQASKNLRDGQALSKEQMAAIARQQLLEISVNPSPVIDNLQAETICDELRMEKEFEVITIEKLDFGDLNDGPFVPAVSDATTKRIIRRPMLDYTCDICSATFKKKNLLKSHMQFHWESCVNFKCERNGCKYQTNSSDALIKHFKEHNPVKPFQCGTCMKEFKRQCDLVTHQKAVHATVKVYVKCEKCSKIILENSLKSHMINRHTAKADYKPFVCKLCGKRERYAKSIERHINSAHNPQSRGVTYVCGDCPAIFLRLRDLNAHSLEHFQGDLQVCQLCDKRFKSPQDLKLHSKSHAHSPLPCTHCNKIFQTRSGLKKHMRKHNLEEE